MIKFLKQQLTTRYTDRVIAYHAYRQSHEILRPGRNRTSYGFEAAGHKDMQDSIFEAEGFALIHQYLEDTSVFGDAGANAGVFGSLGRRMRKHVIAVEPQRRNVDFLFANFPANKLNDAEVFPVGLGDQ